MLNFIKAVQLLHLVSCFLLSQAYPKEFDCFLLARWGLFFPRLDWSLYGGFCWLATNNHDDKIHNISSISTYTMTWYLLWWSLPRVRQDKRFQNSQSLHTVIALWNLSSALIRSVSVTGKKLVWNKAWGYKFVMMLMSLQGEARCQVGDEKRHERAQTIKHHFPNS